MRRFSMLSVVLLALGGCDGKDTSPETDEAQAATEDESKLQAEAESPGPHGKRGGPHGERRGPHGKRGGAHGKRGGAHGGPRGEGGPPHGRRPPPRRPQLEDRVLADSGLGVGGKLSPFQILNCEDGEEYCQVCRYGSSPKLMAVGTADDEAFRKDLQDLDAMVKKYGSDKVKAFAVITEIEDGKAVTPKDPEASRAKAKALKAELGLDFPVVVPAPEDGHNETWERYYNITKSRTVMFSNGRNQVKYSAVEPSDFADLGEAIEAVLGA
ncbi:MAG: hypothetical protein ACRBN8_32125 [Nannocystales bacterium]